MSDPIAVSILSKLTSWYDFEGNGNDSHGANNLTIAASNGYDTGRVGQEIALGARASFTLGTSIPVTTTTGQLSIGGWLNFSASQPLVGLFGFTQGIFSKNEVMTVTNDNANGRFAVFGWEAGGAASYSAEDPTNPTLEYPITVRVDDSSGQHQSSPQIIAIGQPSGIPPGFYFISATWNNGVLTLYKNGRQVAQTTVVNVQSPISYFQIANAYNATLTYCGLDSVFFCTGAVMTAQEMAWLYNAGAGWNHAGIVAAAA